jgi:transposase InsO family protein
VSVFRFIAAEKANYPISLLCRMLGVSRSGFHAWERRAPSDRDLADAWLVEQIKEIHAESRQTYGARRVHRALRHRGLRVGRKRVERLMRREQISGLVPKRFRRTTIRAPGVRVADDLVERDLVPAAPNRLWVADIKYVRTWQGWLYLAAVMDCYSRRIVGWSMRPRHRLSRGGHRQANSALYRTVIVRMRFHQPTIDYVTRRSREGRSKRDIIRCLKRFLAREIYAHFMNDRAALATTT